MFFLGLSILFNTGIFVLFKWISFHKVRLFRVIVVNYFVAAALGFILRGMDAALSGFYGPLLIPSFILGSVFVFVFYLMAITTKLAGLSRAVVANKVSLIVPVVFGVFLYNESLGWLKVTGIVFSIAGILLLSLGHGKKVHNSGGILISVLFIVSGLLDAGLKFAQSTSMGFGEELTFTTMIFSFAFAMGIPSLSFIRERSVSSKFIVDLKYGVILGVINVGSIYFLLRALESPGMDSSLVFPMNNMMVIALASILASLLFSEKMIRKKYVGLVFSMFSLLLLYFSSI